MSNTTKGPFMQAMEKYTKSIKAFISAQGFGHYSKPSGGTIKEKYRGLVNALYAIAPIQWKTYNKLIGKIQDKAFSE